MKITLSELYNRLAEYPSYMKCNGTEIKQSQIADYMFKNKNVEVSDFSIFVFNGGIGLEVIL